MTDDPTTTPDDITPEQAEAIERFMVEFSGQITKLVESLNMFAFLMGQSIGAMYSVISEMQHRHPDLFVLVDGVPDDDGDDSPPDPA